MVTVLMTEEMRLDDSDEKSGKKNDQDESGVKKQEVNQRQGDACQNKRFVIFEEEDDGG